MYSIKIGSLNVPIVDTVELSGRPIASPPEVEAIILPASKYGGQGVTCGLRKNPFSPDPITTETMLYSGVTNFHDSFTLEVGMPQETWGEAAYGWQNPAIFYKGITPHGSSFDIITCGSYNAYTPYDDIGTYQMVAIRYRFLGGETEAEKVNSYFIVILYHEVRLDSEHIVVSDTYEVYSTFYVPLAFNNRMEDWETYYEEEYTPDEHTDPNDEGDPADEGGGDGDHTPIYDPIPIPNAPTLGGANAGFITMYKLGLAAINTFASDMFASNVWEAIRLFFSNPIDFLVGCMLLPFEPETGSSYHPKFGLIAFEHAYPAVSNQYKDIDCGSINISKYWGSCFDYEPFTKIQIWLPYIGYRDLPVDEIMDMTVSVKYRCDCLTGDCVAFVYTGVVGQTGPQVERVIAQFYGNCGVRVPFGSVSYDSAVAASIQLMGAAATTGLSAGAGAMSQTGGAIGGLIAGADAVMTDGNVRSASIGVVQGLKPNVHKGGAAGASTGYMSIQKPYIIKRIPRQNLPSNFMQLKGYPSNIGGKLADFTGLAVVDDIQLNDIPAMEDERKEIIEWLRGGVLI